MWASLTAQTTEAFAASLTPGDRYQSGWNHGQADEQAHKPSFCSDDHSMIYCNGYDDGYDNVQQGHWHNYH